MASFDYYSAQKQNGTIEGDARWFGGTKSDLDGSYFFQELPEDVLSLLSSSLCPRDLCNLGLTCRKLQILCSSDKLWWPHCHFALNNRSVDLQSWRTAVPSYKSIYRFILSVKPLLGIWVRAIPETGNLVYCTWGFLSVVGCRIIPQKLRPRGLETGLLWSPVFEIVGQPDGSLAFFLYGGEGERDCDPGCFDGAREDCNVLLLEAEPRLRSGSAVSDASLTFVAEADNGEDERYGAKPSKCKAAAEHGPVPFHRLHVADRKKILEAVARHVRLKLPQCAVEPLFPRARNGLNKNMDAASVKMKFHKEVHSLTDRWSLLLRMYSNGDPNGRRPPTVTHFNGINSGDLLDKLCCPSDYTSSMLMLRSADGGEPSKGKAPVGVTDTVNSGLSALRNGASLESQSKKSRRLPKFIRDKTEQITGIGNTEEAGKSNEGDESVGSKRVLLLQRFVKQGDTVALRLHARYLELKSYMAWPLMPVDNRFQLYKMIEQKPDKGREHAGLWGGTFGWPPGKPAEGKPGKALYFLLLSYDEKERILIATKILEGTQIVLYPNGSPMFTANVDEPSSQSFPWQIDRDGAPVDILHAYEGEGIAHGYGFRYPSSKPGDLFVERKGLLAFVWRESQHVLTLQRLDLPALLENGERVAAVSPMANYSFLANS